MAYEFKLKASIARDYEAWVRPSRDKRAFVEKSTKRRGLDYFVIELKPESIKTTSGRKKVSLRTSNPTICVFNEWQAPLFNDIEATIEDENPATNRVFDTGLAIGGAFYSVKAPHTNDKQKHWNNMLLFIDENDNSSIDVIEEQFKHSVRAAMKSGTVFDNEQEMMEYIADILVDYPL